MSRVIIDVKPSFIHVKELERYRAYSVAQVGTWMTFSLTATLVTPSPGPVARVDTVDLV